MGELLRDTSDSSVVSHHGTNFCINTSNLCRPHQISNPVLIIHVNFVVIIIVAVVRLGNFLVVSNDVTLVIPSLPRYSSRYDKTVGHVPRIVGYDPATNEPFLVVDDGRRRRDVVLVRLCDEPSRQQ